jgi:putative two-component system response regulator
MTELIHMRLLLVDADATGRQLLVQAGYSDVLLTEDPTSTRRLCIDERPDLMLLDLDAPGSQQALEEIWPLTDGPEGLPVLALTADSTPEARRRAVSLGVRDFVAKPIDETELLRRVRNVLQARELQNRLRDLTTMLKEATLNRTTELTTLRESLSVLAAIADYHDDDAYPHAQRVGREAAAIARALDLPEPFVVMIRDAAPLHDIGKTGMSRRILLKPGPLTPAEWVHMMRHVDIGAQILASAHSPVLRLAAEIARTHHERWDGSGYSAGLAGEEIPLSGRITALADVWDTLTHERPYKPAWDEDRALAEIMGQPGQFDPQVVEAFCTIDRKGVNESHSAEVTKPAA